MLRFNRAINLPALQQAGQLTHIRIFFTVEVARVTPQALPSF